MVSSLDLFPFQGCRHVHDGCRTLPPHQSRRSIILAAQQAEIMGGMERILAPPGALYTFPSAVRITSGVMGCTVTRAPKGSSASFTAFIATAGAAPVPDSP